MFVKLYQLQGIMMIKNMQINKDFTYLNLVGKAGSWRTCRKMRLTHKKQGDVS